MFAERFCTVRLLLGLQILGYTQVYCILVGNCDIHAEQKSLFMDEAK
jgi:hypothetical protein